MPIIQAATIDGKIINSAKWEVDTLQNLTEGQDISVSLAIKDKKLISFLAKQSGADIILEKEGNDYSVNLTFKITKFNHMLESNGSSSSLDSMVLIVPSDRTVEGVISYLLEPNMCNPRFRSLFR